MFSNRKLVIRIAELLAIAGIAACIALVLALSTGRVSAQRVASLLPPLLLAGFAVFTAAAMLFHELARLLHGPPGALQDVELSLGELRLLLRWCPGVLKLAFVGAGFILAYTFTSIGSVEWSFKQPFTDREAKGFSLFMSVFMLAALPVLASASRMPGSFADQIAQRSRRNAALSPATANDRSAR